MNDYYLYILKDPYNKKIRYIGISNFPKKRLYLHKRFSKNKKLLSWLSNLKNKGKSPILKILAKDSFKNILIKEKNLIKLYKKKNIFNISNNRKKDNKIRLDITIDEKISERFRKKFTRKKGDLSLEIEKLMKEKLNKRIKVE